MGRTRGNDAIDLLCVKTSHWGCLVMWTSEYGFQKSSSSVRKLFPWISKVGKDKELWVDSQLKIVCQSQGPILFSN